MRCSNASPRATSGSPIGTSAAAGSSSAWSRAGVTSWSASTRRTCAGRRPAHGPTWGGSPIDERGRILCDGSGQARMMTVRRIRLVLDQPTENGEREIFLLSDVPAEVAEGRTLATIYRTRWTVENVFQILVEALHCEIDTLAYPKAALFGFSTALVAYNVVAAVRAALRSAHGAEQVEGKVSTYSLAEEVASTYEGMMIALPPQEWAVFRTVGAVEFAEFLQATAGLAWLAKYPLSHRGPKKPRPKRASGKRNHHVATARLLDQKKRHNR